MKLPLYYQRKAIEMKNWLVAESEQSNWDRRNGATGEMYCIHGVNLGTWDGPDYMCGWCEGDYTHYDVALSRAYDMWQRDRERIGIAVRELLTKPDDDGLMVRDVLDTKELMTLYAASLWLTGDLKREITSITDALEALT